MSFFRIEDADWQRLEQLFSENAVLVSEFQYTYLSESCTVERFIESFEQSLLGHSRLEIRSTAAIDRPSDGAYIVPLAAGIRGGIRSRAPIRRSENASCKIGSSILSQ